MAEFKGDYLGFTFGGHHSSEFGIVRTSSSNRYEDKLNGTLKENTQARTNEDGTFYFGTTISQKQFTINFAFDHMTETQFNDMKKWLNPKEIKDLIFDEDNPTYAEEVTFDGYMIGNPLQRVGKIWKAKVTGQTSVKHLCFIEDTYVNGSIRKQRIYKGEGTIQFTCYFPYARGQEIQLQSDTIVYGDVPTSFTMEFSITDQATYNKIPKMRFMVNSGGESSWWQLSNGYTLPPYTTGTIAIITWNSETGLVKINNSIVPITGSSIGKLTPNAIANAQYHIDAEQNDQGVTIVSEETVTIFSSIKYNPLYL